MDVIMILPNSDDYFQEVGHLNTAFHEKNNAALVPGFV